MAFSEFPDAQLFENLALKHGHYCPMSTLGLRIGWAALRTLDGIDSASYHAKTCAVDGIRLVFGSEGLEVNDQGQHVLRFSDNKSSWQIELLPETLELAASYRQLATENERNLLLEKLRFADESGLLLIKQDMA